MPGKIFTKVSQGSCPSVIERAGIAIRTAVGLGKTVGIIAVAGARGLAEPAVASLRSDAQFVRQCVEFARNPDPGLLFTWFRRH